jgi:hypothetical protein
LLRKATETDSIAQRNRLEEIVRAVAQGGDVPRARLARRLIRHSSRTEVYHSINALLDEDFLMERDGALRLADPVIAPWPGVGPR